MPYAAWLLMWTWAATTVPAPLGASEPLPTESLFRNSAGVDDRPQALQDYGLLEETPNQRRLRLGEPIVAASMVSESDYGERVETPNERRKRLGLPMPWDGEQGVAEETPNARRARLASQTANRQPSQPL